MGPPVTIATARSALARCALSQNMSPRTRGVQPSHPWPKCRYFESPRVLVRSAGGLRRGHVLDATDRPCRWPARSRTSRSVRRSRREMAAGCVELVAARAVDGRWHRRATGQRAHGRPVEIGAAGAFAHKGVPRDRSPERTEGHDDGAIVEEVVALASTQRVDLAGDTVDRIVGFAAALDPTAYSSLHHDLVGGRRIELDALHGYVTQHSRTQGLAAPMNEAIYACSSPTPRAHRTGTVKAFLRRTGSHHDRQAAQGRCR